MGNFDRNQRGGGGSFGRRNFAPQRFDRNDGRRGGDREMFKTVCSNCGRDCEVPFRPTSGKPVYCSDCFEKLGGGRSDSRRDDRPDYRSPAPSFNQNNSQMVDLSKKVEAINAKLDQLLKLLEPKSETVVTKVESVIDEKPAPKPAKKVKKAEKA